MFMLPSRPRLKLHLRAQHLGAAARVQHLHCFNLYSDNNILSVLCFLTKHYFTGDVYVLV